MRRANVWVAGAMIVALAGCGESDPAGSGEQTGGHETVRSSLARETNPDVSAEQVAELTQGGRELTFEIYRETALEGANYFASALSIQLAFALVYAGARGQTATEMAEVLRFGTDAESFHATMNAIDLAMTARNLPEDVDGDGRPLDPVELHVANAFWGQAGYPWLPSYLDLIALNYGAGIEALDFDTDPEAARQTINAWVEERTRERIVDLLPEGSIGADTAAVLTNAIYFKAPWEAKFDVDLSFEGTFTRVDASEVDAEYMTQLDAHNYAEGEGWQALEMSFRGDALAMLFILPAEGQFAAFDATFDVSSLDAVVAALEPTMVDVELPKFTFETEFTLSEALQSLGMETAFTGACDLSGMLEGGGLFVDEAYHKAFIAIDETGAEAAAATAVVVGETSAPEPEASFVANRPFFFAIRDRETGALLFFGRLLDPSAGG